MVNVLTTLREDISDALTEAGIKAVEYVQENIVPPVAVVVPADPYVTLPEGRNPYGSPYSVKMQILVIAGKGTNKTTANKIDSMIVDVLDALDDWDITEVTAPQEVRLKGVPYMGAVVTLESNTKLEKEVM